MCVPERAGHADGEELGSDLHAFATAMGWPLRLRLVVRLEMAAIDSKDWA